MSRRFSIKSSFFIGVFSVPALCFMLLAAPVKADETKTQDTKTTDIKAPDTNTPDAKAQETKAQGGKTEDAQEPITMTKGPITVTSRTLSADQKARQALFEGDVIARSEEMTMYADRMLVTYAEKGGIEHMVSDGSVKLIKAGRVITAGKAEYFRGEDKIIFSISPKVVEGKTVITGTTIVYYLNDERTDVLDSKVLIDNGGK